MRVEHAMPIALESGARFGRGVPEAAAACGGSSSAGRDSDSRAEAVHAEEAEESDGEVQSSLRGPFDTMDALQDALPRRREVSKFYNIKSGSLSNAMDVVLSPPKGLANPESPSPKKRKGPLPFGINQNETQSKELSSVRDDTSSPMHCGCRKSYPDVTSSSPCKSRNSDERECCKNLPCHCLQRRFSDTNDSSSPPVALQTQLVSVQTTSVSMVGQDVAESTDVSPREKRRKN
uniref:Uncharacterized protein n=1 Tax=Avena sativa TaxID=4498 RepID=A0ACD5ZU87_AVESA